ncbi:MAG: hypothetical protein PWQ77_2081 [Kosmotogales bacterium]|nr:hypothetical protein [Kosmotogales bacterium]
MIKHLIWDFDGTLCNTYPAMVKKIKKALNNLGHDADEEEILRQAKTTMRNAFDYFSEKFDLGDKLYEEFISMPNNPEHMSPYAHVVDVCELINSRGGKNIIITHRGKETTYEILDYYKMTDLFYEIVTADDNFRKKPDSHAFDYVVEKYGFNKDEVLGIGDRELDILAAKGAGIKTCYFDELGKKISAIPDIHIDDYKKLYEILAHEK